VTAQQCEPRGLRRVWRGLKLEKRCDQRPEDYVGFRGEEEEEEDFA